MRHLSVLHLVTLVCVASLSACNCQRRAAIETPIDELQSCPEDERCATGLCDAVPGPNGTKVCLRPCTQTCRDTDICTRLGDDRYACVPEKAGLCAQCQQDSDCPQPADKCIKLGDQNFCGRDCSFDGKCPNSFRCADATGVDGFPAPRQCQPTSGTCECIAATTGQQVPCSATNNFGTCNGVSVCRPPDGYTACSARTPTGEVCNGVDDDCNGMTDEGIADLTCGLGECRRTAAACANGTAQTCTPGTPGTETCNGRDDDCDGTVDNGFDLQTSASHCGACNQACTLTNAVPKCEAGGCAIERCVAGWTDLDHVASNGCEYPCTPSDAGVEVCDGLDNDCNGVVDDGFNLVNDPTNCGQCNLVCSVPGTSVATYACVARVCAIGTCAPGRGNCNQSYADGCEVDLGSDLNHCGLCGVACTTPNATPVCAAGQCGVAQCNPGFGNCNGQVADGCEVNTNLSVANCGACGNQCSAANATSSCSNGSCAFTCQPNWWDVDGQSANGCEYACIKTAGGVEACDGIDNDCDNRVDEDFDLTTDARHCGACNRACSAPFATTTCSASSCGITACDVGRANCNAVYADGCEVTTGTDLNNCGACNNRCTAANGTPSCTAGACGIAACTPGFANCNNQVSDGCEVNTNTSITNCGACNAQCAPANASPVCANGTCGIGACLPGYVNLNGLVSDGCEYFCTPSNGGVERCDGVDNNCNGQVDETFTLATDVNNCGTCGNVCSAPNVTVPRCVASTCGVQQCANGTANCNNQFADGCEVNTNTSLANCGACGSVCTTPNATPVCTNGGCQIASCTGTFRDCNGTVSDGCEVNVNGNVDACGTCGVVCPTRANASRYCAANLCGYSCNAGFVDLDKSPTNGCEYACAASGVDVPDDASGDQDCDGIDGEAARAIFVSLTGNDSNVGSRAAPKRTVQAAINAASATVNHVYVSTGTYDEAITLRDGISVFGGYSEANDWARNTSLYPVTLRNAVVSNGRIVAVSGANLTTLTTLAYLTIRAADTAVAGASTYGLHCVNCTGLTLRSNTIIGGAAGAGVAGSNGSAGANGNPGGNGGGGSCDGAAGGGGTGGTSTCGRAGGNGGNGGAEGANNGQTGGTGQISTSGGGAGAGCYASSFLCTDGSCTASPGGNGNSGTTGAAGTNGNGGNGPTVVGNFLVCIAGADGSDGTSGNGGGGGGGGGGQGGPCAVDGGGNGAGGGGSGGCAGTRATGGTAGGSSFAVFLVNSSGVVISNCTLSSGSAGSGGAGGSGGSGGTGGTGGAGATTCTGQVGRGGNGGAGGNGGRGGHGGGGSGGLSYALYKVNSAPMVSAVTYSHGNAGTGGASLGNAGAAGTAADFN
jgi:hypothetical protein